MNPKYTILAAVFVLGCTTLHDSSDQRATAAQQSEFRNLLVLPRDIPRDDLIATMRSFNRGLGVKCNFCHVVATTEPKEEFDFPSDAKEQKRIARVMLQMTQQINGPWLERVEHAEDHDHASGEAEASEDEGPRVTCWTCHRGREEPEMPPPPPPETTAPRPAH